MAESKTSLDTYIKWIRENGLVVYTPRIAGLSFLDIAIEEYGLERVRQEIEPIIPELIEITYRRGVTTWGGDTVYEKKERQLYESFRDAYNKGEEINIGPITVKKRREALQNKEGMVEYQGPKVPKIWHRRKKREVRR